MVIAPPVGVRSMSVEHASSPDTGANDDAVAGTEA